MINRIDQKFAELKKGGRKAFIAYVTAGLPSMSVSLEVILALEEAGVDMVEIGIPFSDPMADGTTIQAASKMALDNGATVAKAFDLARKLRQHTQMPLLFMTYYNPVFHYGLEKFIKHCVEVGIDGLIIPDLPPEEAGELRHYCRKAGIATIFFIAPTTQDARIKANAKASSGFIYYVSLTGVTGNAKADAADVIRSIQHAKRFTNKPICAGFGISTPQQVKEIAKVADGVIVGSAIVKKIMECAGRKDLAKEVGHFVGTLSAPLKV